MTAEPANLPDQELPGSPVLPVPVIEVTGGHDEIDFLRDRVVDEGGEGVPSCAADAVGGTVWVCLQTTQRAVDVEVGTVEELEGRHGWSGRHGTASSQAQFLLLVVAPIQATPLIWDVAGPDEL